MNDWKIFLKIQEISNSISDIRVGNHGITKKEVKEEISLLQQELLAYKSSLGFLSEQDYAEWYKDKFQKLNKLDSNQYNQFVIDVNQDKNVEKYFC